MGAHRIAGLMLAGFGLALLIGQFAMLYGSARQQAAMVDLGFGVVSVLTGAGAVSVAVGCLMATAPHLVRRSLRRDAGRQPRPRPGRAPHPSQ